ncbi:MAG TPA: flagellar biosynthesis protein FlgF, partial [Oceanospirillaceae bacterium]|nr:flagellar biosynthesis protein FlgF [Oceanospirillaceae bacterium]
SMSNVVDMAPGALMVTGNPMDVYVEGEGALAVVGGNGSELYTRRGDIRIGADKSLVNGRGQVLMDISGGPIKVPPGSQLEINSEGQVTMMPAGGGDRKQIGALKIVDTAGVVLTNREDGLLESDQPALPVAPEIKVTPKAIEGSSVNAIDSMVRMIELSRQYEMSVNMLKQAREVDSAGASTMRMS